MKPGPFSYHRPGALDEALGLLAEHGEQGKVLAGGQSLVPMLNLRLSRPDHLIDVNHLQLDTVEAGNGTLTLGALVRHRTLEVDPLVSQHAPLLAAAAPLIGHLPIRVRGTLAGSIVHADPAAELPAVMTALDATVQVRSASGGRTIAAGDLFDGPFMTTLADDELALAVEVPVHGDHACVYEELAVSAGDFAVVGVALALRTGADGRVESVRLALSGVSGIPVRAREAEALLHGGTLEPDMLEAAGAAAAAATSPSSDVHGSADYRRHLADVLTQRALARAGTTGSGR